MKILLFVPEALPTFRADVAALFGRYLPDEGVHTHLVGMPGKVGEAMPGFVSSIVSSARGGRARRELAFLWRALTVLLRTPGKDFNLVQVRDMVPVGLLGWLIARLRGKPFVYWMSYLMSEGRLERARSRLQGRGRYPAKFRELFVWLKGWLEYRLLYGFLLPRADFVFVQSAAMLEHVAQRGILRERMQAVPMGVDLERMQALVPLRLPGWKGVPIIAYLGTLDGSRELHVLIDVLQRVRQKHEGARLLLIGSSHKSDDELALLKHAEKVGLAEAVHITGWLPAEEAWPLLAGADVAISYFPRGSLLDTNSPTKLVEYLALGLPCVGNDNPDQREVLRESEAGELTESSVEALAGGVCRLLNDPGRAQARAARGPAWVAAHRAYVVLAAKVAERYRAIGGRA